MHILFLHQNCPAQYGPFIQWLRQHTDWRITFCHRVPLAQLPGVEEIVYEQTGGATEKTSYFSRTFENMAHQSVSALRAMQARPDIKPDLILAHSGFVSGVPLQELYQCPRLAYLEYFYHTKNSDMDFRPEQRTTLDDQIRARFRNSSLLLDLDSAHRGLCPTHWQRTRFPINFQDKIDVIFDGIDSAIWYRRPASSPRRWNHLQIPDSVELVTYAARGFESMRGFDVFMRFAKELYQRRRNVRFVVVGADRVCYGGDSNFTGGLSFKEWVLKQDHYDLSKFVFVPPVPAEQLAELFSISDLHVYLTVPFVLSWSLMNAMACGATILASNTAPVREVIETGTHGVLVDFFDVEAMVANAERLLSDRELARSLGANAMSRIQDQYAIDVTALKLRKLIESMGAN